MLKSLDLLSGAMMCTRSVALVMLLASLCNTIVAFIPPLSGHDEEHKYDFQIESESGSDEEDLNEVREGKSVSLLKLVLVVCAIGIVLLFTITVVLCLGCRYCKRLRSECLAKLRQCTCSESGPTLNV